MKPQTLLKTLLVLSIIGSGMGFLGHFGMGAFHSYYARLLEVQPSPFPDEWRLMLENYLRMPPLFFFVQAALYALSLTGVFFMWRLRREGFHCYTIAQLLLLCWPPLFFGKGSVDIGSLMFTALFVFYYWRLLKALGAFSDSSENEDTTESGQ